ncbi:MAG: hypothetical protein DRH08_13960, partial [Deltaproteobacteria bacterium]
AEILRGYSGGILWGTGIACRGNAGSVKVFCTCPLQDLKWIRADRGSRSSVALLKIILSEMYGVEPFFEEMVPEPMMIPGQDEGLLIIGDRCFEFEQALAQCGREDIHGWDLGNLWLELTGLPFVFAAWALAPDFIEEFGKQQALELCDVLNKARSYGLDNLGFLARREVSHGCLGVDGSSTFEAVDIYLRDFLKYDLGNEEFVSMHRFHGLGIKHGVFPDVPFPFLFQIAEMKNEF